LAAIRVLAANGTSVRRLRPRDVAAGLSRGEVKAVPSLGADFDDFATSRSSEEDLGSDE
jgi:hypothetical protein